MNHAIVKMIEDAGLEVADVLHIIRAAQDLKGSEPSNPVYRHALEHWGAAAQVSMAMGEYGELIAELNRLFTQNKSTVEAVASEVADVEIMMSQLRLVVGSDIVESIKQEKLARLKAILDGEEYHPHQSKAETDKSEISRVLEKLRTAIQEAEAFDLVRTENGQVITGATFEDGGFVLKEG
ncbi:hypothetical protein [Grimontia hollisae]|uniref:hypothetical protein n=1 Tax=Grimontia hollisae TaxID=673 RepID=UPI000DFA1772|nr:hypothetical protein [Grimontia hollisae]STQ75517.1 Uncharacterised protein [Grimontia hollisae]